MKHQFLLMFLVSFNLAGMDLLNKIAEIQSIADINSSKLAQLLERHFTRLVQQLTDSVNTQGALENFIASIHEHHGSLNRSLFNACITTGDTYYFNRTWFNKKAYIKLLLSMGADSNTQGTANENYQMPYLPFHQFQTTCLHLCCDRMQSPIVRKFLRFGANPLHRDQLGNTPLDLARYHHSNELKVMLKAHIKSAIPLNRRIQFRLKTVHFNTKQKKIECQKRLYWLLVTIALRIAPPETTVDFVV